jgi:hypothetical protein
MHRGLRIKQGACSCKDSWRQQAMHA